MSPDIYNLSLSSIDSVEEFNKTTMNRTSVLAIKVIVRLIGMLIATCVVELVDFGNQYFGGIFGVVNGLYLCEIT